MCPIYVEKNSPALRAKSATELWQMCGATTLALPSFAVARTATWYRPDPEWSVKKAEYTPSPAMVSAPAQAHERLQTTSKRTSHTNRKSAAIQHEQLGATTQLCPRLERASCFTALVAYGGCWLFIMPAKTS